MALLGASLVRDSLYFGSLVKVLEVEAFAMVFLLISCESLIESQEGLKKTKCQITWH